MSCFTDGHIRLAMALVANVSHDQGVIEFHAAFRKHGVVGEERGFHMVHGQRAYLPAVRLKPDAVEPTAIACDRITDFATLEKARRLG